MNARALAHPRLNCTISSSPFSPTTPIKTPFPFPNRYRPSRPGASSTACRWIHPYAKVKPVRTASSRISNDPTLDERIGAPRAPAHLVDDAGRLQPPQPLGYLLEQLDWPREHLRRVGQTGDGTPVCKVVTEESLMEQLRLQEVAVKKKDVSEAAKQIELTWSISENDLAHRLKRVQEFLREGKRVEILIAPKKKGRRADAEEIQALMQRVEGTIKDVEGAEEWKAMTGEPGKRVEMYFSGPVEGEKAVREREVSKTLERMKRKEAEEMERKEKEEKRLRRKQEQVEQKANLAGTLVK